MRSVSCHSQRLSGTWRVGEIADLSTCVKAHSKLGGEIHMTARNDRRCNVDRAICDGAIASTSRAVDRAQQAIAGADEEALALAAWSNWGRTPEGGTKPGGRHDGQREATLCRRDESEVGATERLGSLPIEIQSIWCARLPPSPRKWREVSRPTKQAVSRRAARELRSRASGIARGMHPSFWDA